MQTADKTLNNVYIVQANPVYGEADKTVYIPYAAGCVAAYAWADKRVKEHFRLGRFIYTRENVETAAASLEAPVLAAFSCSVWNMEYNKALAKEIKERHPACLILFGGHHVSPDAGTLEENGFTDILVHGGGEEAFRDVLLAMAGYIPWGNIPNISFRGTDGGITTTEKKHCDTKDYPSPYLEGYFDELLKDDIRFSAIIETNRGCPNNCAFCDWGDLKTKVRLFPMEKIERELRWIAEKKIEYIYCGDANFGLFERDNQITDLIAQLKKEKGFPQRFRVNIAKNITATVEDIIGKFYANSLDKSLPLSYQSLSPAALSNIGRKNMDLNHFKELMALYNRTGVSTSSELILGLPGETHDSFCEGICTLLECGQHKSINVYACELLPNSRLGDPLFQQKHGIESVRLPFYQIHCKIPDSATEIQEYSEFIVATATMSREEWVRTAIFAFTVLALHNLGLTRAISMYLRHERGVSYLDFYTGLLQYFKQTPGTFVYEVYENLKELTASVSEGRHAWVFAFEQFGNLTWGFEELTFLELVKNSGAFYRETGEFLKRYRLNEMEEPLLRYQQSLVKLPFETKDRIESDYDFTAYFENIYRGNYKPLEKKRTVLHICNNRAAESWEDYAREIVWLGRREDAQLYTCGRYLPSVEYP